MLDMYDWDEKAKDYQRPPKGDWHTWFLSGGRGSGTTRAGVEWVRKQAQLPNQRILVVMRTDSDARNVFVEGESGIFAVSPPAEKPTYEPSKRKLIWEKTGSQALLVSADAPDTLRGLQVNSALWMDPKVDQVDVLYNIQLATRLGDTPQIMVAGTLDRPGLLRDEINRLLVKDPFHIRLSLGHYTAIQEHLDPKWIKIMKDMGSI